MEMEEQNKTTPDLLLHLSFQVKRDTESNSWFKLLLRY